MNNILPLILIFTLIYWCDWSMTKNTALGKILDVPNLGGSLVSNMLVFIFTIGCLIRIYKNNVIGVFEIGFFIGVIVHFFLLKYGTKYHYKNIKKEFNKNPKEFVKNHKEIVRATYNKEILSYLEDK